MDTPLRLTRQAVAQHRLEQHVEVPVAQWGGRGRGEGRQRWGGQEEGVKAGDAARHALHQVRSLAKGAGAGPRGVTPCTHVRRMY